MLFKGVNGKCQIKYICFDVDGTLYDIRSMRKAMFKELLVGLFLRKISFQEIRILHSYRKTLENLRKEVIYSDQSLSGFHTREVSEKVGCTSEMVETVVNKWMIDVPCGKMHGLIWPDIKDTLIKLTEKGYCLAVLSDYPAKKKVEAMGLNNVFEVILSCQDEGSRGYKPNTNGFQNIIQFFDAKPCECIYIGDSYERDVIGAIENQMHAVLLSPYVKKKKEQPQEFTVINEISDLLRVLP